MAGSIALNARSLLKAFSEFAEKADWNRVATILNDKSVSEATFFATIPKNAAEFALFLRTPLTFEAFNASVPKELADQLRKAKEIADLHLAGIEGHPVLANLIHERIRSVSAHEDDLSSTPLTALSALNAIPMWLENDAGLVPVSSITLRGEDRESILEGIFDWDDITFLMIALVRVLESELQRANDMRKHQALFLLHDKIVGERIYELNRLVSQIGGAAAALGIPVQKRNADQ